MAWSNSSNGRQADRPKIEPAVFVLVSIALLIGWVSWQRGYLTIADVAFYSMLIPSIILHEVSHGALANLFGDDTAKRAGRLTLNPLRHVDPWGTFIIPAALLLTAGLAFGYAKPVPVNTSRMSRNQAMFTGLVGPFVNILIAIGAAIALYVMGAPSDFGYLTYPELFVLQLGLANVVLAAFNLIPIPPLDGSSVIERFLPSKYWAGYLKFRQYSMIILLVIMLFANSFLSIVFNPAIQLWATITPPGISEIVNRLFGF